MLYLIQLLLFLSMATWVSQGLAETTSPSTPLQITITGGNATLNPTFGFVPRKASFSDDRNQARCFANKSWNNLSYEDKAMFIDDTYRILLHLHQNKNNPNDDSFKFSSRILTCKTFKESSFDPQIGNESGSSAVGLGQVLTGTAEDLLGPRIGFRSKLPGYENVSDYSDYKTKMAKEITLQLELSMGVLEMKRNDFNLSIDNIKPLLQRYLGSSSDSDNEAYANSIYDCAACAKRNNGMFSQECLCKTKPNDTNCTKILKAPEPRC
jgi:hypothetical protein